MKKGPFAFSSLIFLTVALTFTACGSLDNSLNPPTTPEPESVSSVPDESSPVSEASEPISEEELRQAIAALADEGDVMPQKQEYYEKLYAMDLFTEEDYLALAQVYADAGDWERQRLMLSKALRLYPSREYAQLLSDIVIKTDSGDEDMASFAAQITSALERQDAAALSSLIQSQEWQRLFPADPAGAAAGIETRIQYRAENSVLQILMDGLTTEITWLPEPDRLLCCRSDAGGTMFASASRKDDAYSGPVTVSYFDGTGEMVRSFQGTLSGNICVDRFTISYRGTEYSGRLNETGMTLEEQLKEVTQKGSVIYAYGPGEKTYLYKENTTVEDFRIDAAYLGLPEYTEWR